MASVHTPSGVPYDRRRVMPPAAFVCLARHVVIALVTVTVLGGIRRRF
jgi:hypothetical protein